MEISLSIRRPSCPLSVLNIGWWCYIPRSVIKGVPGSVPVVFTVLHYPFRFCFLSHTRSLPSFPSSVTRLLPPKILFPVTFLFPFLLACLLLDYYYQSLLIPPPLGNPKSWPLYCLQAEFQNRLCHDILHDRILAPVYVKIHLFQPNFSNSFSQLGVLAVPVLQSLWLIYLYPPRNPAVETPQHPPDAWGQDPSLCAEEQVSLHYGEVKTPRHPSVRALPTQDS